MVTLEDAEFVMVCMAGSGLAKYTDALLSFATDTGADSIRYHSNRKGIKRILKALDFEPQGLDGSGQVIYKALL